MEIENIKNVAIYLRKSRNEYNEKDVLIEHRAVLVEYAMKKNWNFEIYQEAEISGERLATRPKLIELLNLIEEENSYDAILVIDYQRLSRGNSKDFGTIIDILQFSNCFIATPDKIYDPNNNQDLTMLGIQGVFAHTELKTIVGRFIMGKQEGAKVKGKWTNGKPPYPYLYKKKISITESGKEQIEVKIIIDDEKRRVYEIIKQMFLTGDYGTESIAIHLNKLGYPSPGGKLWSSNAVQRLLVHEFHMGITIYGKYEWKTNHNGKRKVTLRNKDKWFIGKGNWEILKTEEEHQKIIQILKSHTKVPSRSKQGVFPTSGLMICKKCGYTMKYASLRPDKNGKIHNYTKCNHRSLLGEHCKQRGVKLSDEFYEKLYTTVINGYLQSEILKRTEKDSKYLKQREVELSNLKEQLNKHETAMQRIIDAYLYQEDNSKFIIDELSKKGKNIEKEIKNLKTEIMHIENEIENATSYSIKELENKLIIFKKQWPRTKSPEEQNKLLKQIVKQIIYDRQGDTITLEVEYR